MTFVAKNMVNLKYPQYKIAVLQAEVRDVKMSLNYTAKVPLTIYILRIKREITNYVEIIPDLITSIYYPVIINAY